MFPLTPDYNQQMFAYLQAWQQFLEQWAAMMALPRPTCPLDVSHRAIHAAHGAVHAARAALHGANGRRPGAAPHCGATRAG